MSDDFVAGGGRARPGHSWPSSSARAPQACLLRGGSRLMSAGCVPLEVTTAHLSLSVLEGSGLALCHAPPVVPSLGFSNRRSQS